MLLFFLSRSVNKTVSLYLQNILDQGQEDQHGCQSSKPQYPKNSKYNILQSRFFEVKFIQAYWYKHV